MTQGLSLNPVGEHEWVFSYPRAYDESEDYFIEGLEELESNNIEKARSKFKQALSVFPQHIDALHHLSIMAENMNEARKQNELAVEIGLSVFPKKLDIY